MTTIPKISSSEALFAPITVTEFIKTHLEREVLHLERRDPALVTGIFDLDSMGHCLRYMRPQASDAVRVASPDGGGDRSASYLAGTHAAPDAGEAVLRAAFADRHTLIFNYAERYWPPVERIVMDLRRALRSNVHCNVYCTPPSSQGFDTHVDGHDVLVLQTSGSKTWRLHETIVDLPVESSPLVAEMRPGLANAQAKYGEPTREVVLRPGDLLYLPRGVPHSAGATDEHSVHLTIGLYPLRMHELLGRVVDLVAFDAVELRRRTPVEYYRGETSVPSAGDLLRRAATLADALDPPIDVARLLAIIEDEHAAPTDPRGLYRSALAAATIVLDTVVERPAGTEWRTRRTPNDFRVSCGGHMALPLKLEPVLGFLEQHPRFRVGDMPTLLTENAKRTLARNLVKHDLLRVSDQAAPVIEDEPMPAAIGVPSMPLLHRSVSPRTNG